MEEKVIIQGERYKINIRAILIGISIGLIVLGLLVYATGDGYSNYWKEWYSIGDVMFDPFSFTSGLLMDFGIILLPVVLIICWWLSSVELTVTDKRVYGKAAFGKRVDLPIDSVSAVAMNSPKGIAVGTSSGKISFMLIQNQTEVHAALSQLLIERQQAKNAQTVKGNSAGNADELKKYKELLDSGVISQEEFDAKKKQLLGL